MDPVELDNERHRREEQERRAKRHKHKENKSKTGKKSEQERKRREHAQRILGAQKKKPVAPSTKDQGVEGGSSVFQSLFQERAEGFFIDLQFRNAPPRPPVGPTFVGLGLEGELNNKWTKYKARNAVENQYTWKLHAERDVGVPMAVSAMDFDMCYTDPAKKVDESGKVGGKKDTPSLKASATPALHPEDESLINWSKGLGDTVSEQLQQRRDGSRAAARLALSQGHGAMPSRASNSSHNIASTSGGSGSMGGGVRLKKHHLKSRILEENIPFFMKKTTYLTNSATSVHQFKSLAYTKAQIAKDVDDAVEESKKYSEAEMIESGFDEANDMADTQRVHPSKKDVTPVFDFPLLPDGETWENTYTHVVLDNPPKDVIKNKKNGGGKDIQNAKHLQEAIVADVSKDNQNSRMACTVWAPGREESMYEALQQYDLDVVPLRDRSEPPIQYVWMVDPTRKYAGYHSVGSRVQLSTGRPVVLVKAHELSTVASGLASDKSVVLRGSYEEVKEAKLDKKRAETSSDEPEKTDPSTEKNLDPGSGSDEGDAF